MISFLFLAIQFFYTFSSLADLKNCLPSVTNEKNYSTLFKMRTAYLKIDADLGVVRLGENRNQNRIIFKRGLLYFENQLKLEDGHYLVVVDRDRNVYAISINPLQKNRVRHSSLLNGENVLFAGNLTLSNEKITQIDNGSGHYKPSIQSIRVLLEILFLNNIDLRFVSLFYGGNAVLNGTPLNVNALTFLFSDKNAKKCLFNQLKEPEILTKSEILLSERMDPHQFRQFAQFIEKNNKIDSYVEVLKEAILSFPQLSSYFSEETQNVHFKILPTLRCKLLLQKRSLFQRLNSFLFDVFP